MVSEEKKIPEPLSEEITIDLSKVPLVPQGKREIQQLEMALIIATLYSPEVLELIRDPIERATWVDSLAVAASALARQKAGYPISKIAEEVGRSETMIRAHLSGKTKAGRLVLQTYEKLKKGQLKIVVPFIKVPKEMVERVQRLEEELKLLSNVKKEYEEKLKKLQEEINKLKAENEKLRSEIDEKNQIINTIKEKLPALKELIEYVEKL
ncbi:transcriptional regulator [Staphylothermus hellenicus]|uniref:Transcriptional regulator protein-like protein n=1 Tax=Staphylothermus hellenicus (strain DSM 12710 / JCM 10830 / BK20S6-10-b1 / P8) TaxID=591019 RepID=D7DB53_STAHD|nr:transcriptional regulator [Staphylothermus hellenicus]ADI31400.1 transcriptional regulator protein-like protein [Staphylothermus hellenicus DSM 12710]